MRKPRLGFLGTGWIGRHRMEMVAQSGAAEVAVICDPNAQMVEEALKSAPGAEATTDFDELLRADLDGVVIATPSALHAEQAIRAIEKNLAVFCQKPLGRTAAEVRRVLEAARSRDRLLGVDLSYRHTEGMRRIRDRVADGEIGDVYAVDLVFHNAYGPDKAWFYDPRLSGGGCVMDLGVHLVDLALWTLGFPKVSGVTSKLFAAGKPVRDTGSQVEDFANARIDLETGTTIQLSCSWKLPAGCDCVIQANLYGTQGGLALRNVNGSFYDFVAERYRGTAREALASPPDA
ncbi:MAG: Gfo/Idh/MocA family oxidoreductase, partial [Deltaproteobacteria bacterium]|nr:Gfo/Idh/MocA family oxidoreductase [Deltaproteobacteria bacterium]